MCCGPRLAAPRAVLAPGRNFAAEGIGRGGRVRPNFCWERESACGVGCLQRRDPREGPSSPCAGRQRAPPRFFAKIAHVFLSGLGATKMRGSAVIGVTEAVPRGNWLWRCLRTCAVACRVRHLRDVMAEQNVVGPDPEFGTCRRPDGSPSGQKRQARRVDAFRFEKYPHVHQRAMSPCHSSQAPLHASS